MKKLLIVSNSSFNIFKGILDTKILENKLTYDVEYISIDNFLNQKHKGFKHIFLYFSYNDFENYSTYANQLLYKKKHINELIKFLKILFSKLIFIDSANIILSSIPYPKENFFYNLVNQIEFSNYELIREINKFIYLYAKKNNLNLLDTHNLVNRFGIDNYFNPTKYYLARSPFNHNFAKFFFDELISILKIYEGNINKVLVFDLDNTIWGGVIGELGFDNIIINRDETLGKIYLDIQRYILNLKNRGVILAICSKNDQEIALDAFRKNKNMILKLKDISSYRINWNNKADNIREISEELNVSLDSIVFLDDNPAERDLVKKNLPQVSVLEVGDDPSNYLEFIISDGTFEINSFSNSDKFRTQTYNANVKRTKLKSKTIDYNQYLKKLEMRAKFEKVSNKDYERIIQLYNRTNQFNLTTKRIDIKSLKKIMYSENHEIYKVSFTDKFSDYGIISSIIVKFYKNRLLIDNWVLSCRVFGRQIEECILNKIILLAKKSKIKIIESNYIKSNKNIIIPDIYTRLNFKKEKNKYIFKLADNISHLNNYINIK